MVILFTWNMKLLKGRMGQVLLDLITCIRLNSTIVIHHKLSGLDAESILMTACPALGRSGKLSFIIMSFMCFKVLHVLRMSGNLTCDRIQENHRRWHKTNQSLRTAFAASLYGKVLC